MKLLIKTVLLATLITNFCSLESIAQSNSDISNFSLEEMLNTPISAASKYEQKGRNAPASITIITSDDIKRYGYKTLFEVLQSVKGFFGRDTRNYFEMGARGVDRPSDYGNKILLLLNGHTYNDNFYGASVYGNDFGIDMRIVERIEIITGPVSALYGTGAMLAVINVITMEGANFGRFKLKGDIGNLGQKKICFSYGDKLKNEFEFLMNVNYGYMGGEDIYLEEFDSPETNYGVSKGIDWEKYYHTFVKINFKNFIFQGNTSNRTKSLPNASYGMDFNDANAQSIDKRGFLELLYNYEINEKMNLTSRIYYDEFTYSGTYPYTDDTLGYGIWEDENFCRWSGLELKLIWDIVPDNRLIIGTEINHSFESSYKEWDKYEVYFNKNFPHTIYSLYAQDEFQLMDNFSLIGGLRYDYYSYLDDIVSPRIAAVYNFNNYSTIKALYGHSYRAPNNSELFYQSSGQAKPNLNLLGENIRTAEIIYEQKIFKYMQFSGSIFRNDLDNMIQQVLDDSDTLLQFRNIDRIQSHGLELDLKARSDEGYWAYMNYTLQYVMDKETEQKLSNSPMHLFKSGFSFIIAKYSYLGIEFLYESNRITLSNEDYPAKTLQDVYLVNLNFTYEPDYNSDNTFTNLLNKTRMSFRIRNLLDYDYKLPVGYDNFPVQAIRQRGREILFTLSVSFN